MIAFQKVPDLKYALAGFVVAFAASALLFSNTPAQAVVAPNAARAANSEVLFVLADPTDMNQCMSGGWRQHGFKSQGQCFQFTNTGKDGRAGIASTQ